MLNKYLAVLAISAGAALPIIAPAYAHHSVGAFYTDEMVEVEGEVVEFLYVNPHGQLVVQDGNGDYWVGEMGSVLGLRRQGLTPAVLPVGTDIWVHARTSRDGTNRVFVEAIKVGDEVVYGAVDQYDADEEAEADAGAAEADTAEADAAAN